MDGILQPQHERNGAPSLSLKVRPNVGWNKSFIEMPSELWPLKLWQPHQEIKETAKAPVSFAVVQASESLGKMKRPILSNLQACHESVCPIGGTSICPAETVKCSFANDKPLHFLKALYFHIHLLLPQKKLKYQKHSLETMTRVLKMVQDN